MRKKIIRKECGLMPTITCTPNSISNLEILEARLDKLLSNNRDLINTITPFNPTISKDDEWNDPIYDNYAQIDQNGDEEQ